jgi:hypothetical protein
MTDQHVDRRDRTSHPAGTARTAPNHDDTMLIAGEVTVTHSVSERIVVTAGGILVLLGTARSGVVVANGGYARIAGHTEGLLVAVGGHVTLTGTCRGAAVNDGGYLDIQGRVDGPVIAYAGDTTGGPDRPTPVPVDRPRMVDLWHSSGWR